MQMFEVTVLNPDNCSELQRKILFAEDEEDALDQMEEILEKSGVAHGMCQAEEI